MGMTRWAVLFISQKISKNGVNSDIFPLRVPTLGHCSRCPYIFGPHESPRVYDPRRTSSENSRSVYANTYWKLYTNTSYGCLRALLSTML